MFVFTQKEPNVLIRRVLCLKVLNFEAVPTFDPYASGNKRKVQQTSSKFSKMSKRYLIRILICS